MWGVIWVEIGSIQSGYVVVVLHVLCVFCLEFCSYQEYHNAIQYGAMRAGESLPEQYTVEMTRYLNSSKKEKIK